MNQHQQATLIKVAAVVTASPRWVGALLAAEGFAMPETWRWWWIPLSAILSAGMALVEGLAFSFVFNAWRTQKDKSANRLLWLAVMSATIFIFVLAPFIAAQVRQDTLEDVLGTGWPLWLWSASVAASTIIIVASVGYAQKDKPQPRATLARNAPQHDASHAQHPCWCGAEFTSQQGLAAHGRKHIREARQATSVPGALTTLQEKYPNAWDNGNSPITAAEVAGWRQSAETLSNVHT